MIVKRNLMPAVMGGLMGLMMMWMLHGALTGEGTVGRGALIAFVAAHIILVAAIVSAAVFAARLSPRAHAWIERLHRPSLRHIGMMLAGAIAVAGSVHLIAHGGIV
ncbi:hypothetical protein Q4555_14195 [Octadecabacter sp. 1_MG-2023]|uniref:hypothetical protein n=1 Tax=unclassified Octadecabacter TaxID=196158 RepID=UPI001C0A2DBE|nr:MULTISPECIES: hypothetical protein [unclassified Octadecabacter]MBU2991851.1 hypothetical protein [Octadecabacter sp. B2R22]MDO6735825.1 hypothetical protein [Octadecabacter sp. 1_MG-2023]